MRERKTNNKQMVIMIACTEIINEQMDILRDVPACDSKEKEEEQRARTQVLALY